MTHQNVSILIVDDANFTCEMTRRALKNAGYSDIRICNSGERALEVMQRRQADVLLADWMMPDMTGIELTEQTRFLDEENNHYTYILLLTAKDGMETLTEAFDRGVDDFLKKSPYNDELLARIHAGSRVSSLQNTLLQTTTRLTEINHNLEQQSTFDVVTGLGNRFFLEKHLGNLLAQTKSRGGGACCALIRLNDFAGIVKEYGQAAGEEVLQTTAKRLQQSVRPLDIISTVDEGEFAIIMHHEEISHCRALAFKRIYQAINLRTYRTAVGFISVSAAISVCPVEGKKNDKYAAEIIDHLQTQMKIAQDFGRVHETTLAG